MHINAATAVRVEATVKQATWTSKTWVNHDPCRNHGDHFALIVTVDGDLIDHGVLTDNRAFRFYIIFDGTSRCLPGS